MDSIVAFLQEHLGNFFTWWEKTTKLPTVQYEKFSVNWAMVVLVLFIIGGFMLLVGVAGALR